jgi:hypothetical protein
MAVALPTETPPRCRMDTREVEQAGAARDRAARYGRPDDGCLCLIRKTCYSTAYGFVLQQRRNLHGPGSLRPDLANDQTANATFPMSKKTYYNRGLPSRRKPVTAITTPSM